MARSCWLGVVSRREMIIVDFAKRSKMAAVTMHFKKRQEHRKVHASYAEGEM